VSWGLYIAAVPEVKFRLLFLLVFRIYDIVFEKLTLTHTIQAMRDVLTGIDEREVQMILNTAVMAAVEGQSGQNAAVLVPQVDQCLPIANFEFETISKADMVQLLTLFNRAYDTNADLVDAQVAGGVHVGSNFGAAVSFQSADQHPIRESSPESNSGVAAYDYSDLYNKLSVEVKNMLLRFDGDLRKVASCPLLRNIMVFDSPRFVFFICVPIHSHSLCNNVIFRL
jgi:hypothetical protein